MAVLDKNGLQRFYTGLKSKFSALGHKHTKSEITDFAHSHTKSEISDFSHTHNLIDLSGVTINNNTTGHLYLNDLLIQWGSVSNPASNDPYYITYPIAFNSLYYVTFIPYCSGGQDRPPTIKALSNTQLGCKYYGGASNITQVFWMAIGK